MGDVCACRQPKGVSMRILICGIRELFTTVLGKEWPVLEHMHTKRLQKLPIVMERDQIWKIIAHSDNLCHRTYLTLVYTCGLRLSEAVNITVHDIDGRRMRIHIRQGKGGSRAVSETGCPVGAAMKRSEMATIAMSP